MASSRRERDPGSTPGREDAVRPRLEDRSDESLSSGDDVDAAWHEQKGVRYVPVSETFERAFSSSERGRRGWRRRSTGRQRRGKRV